MTSIYLSVVTLVVTFSHFEQDLQNFSDLIKVSINTQNSDDLNPNIIHEEAAGTASAGIANNQDFSGVVNSNDEQISNNTHDFVGNESNLSPKVTKGDYKGDYTQIQSR